MADLTEKMGELSRTAENMEQLQPFLLTSSLSRRQNVDSGDSRSPDASQHSACLSSAATFQHSEVAGEKQSSLGHAVENTEQLEPLSTSVSLARKVVDIEGNKSFYTLPHQRSPSTTTETQLSRTTTKRQSFPGHVVETTQILNPLLASGLSKPNTSTGDDKSSDTLAHQTAPSSVQISQHSEMAKKKHPLTTYLVENAGKMEPLLMSGLTVHQDETGERGRPFNTLPHQTSPSSATSFKVAETTSKRQSVPSLMHDKAEQLEALLTSTSLLQQIVGDGSERFYEASASRTSAPYITSFQHPEETTQDKNPFAGHTVRSSKKLEPVLISDSLATSTQQPFVSDSNRTFVTLPRHSSELSAAPRRYSATVIEKYSSPSYAVNIDTSLDPDFAPRTSAKQTFDSSGTSTTTLLHQTLPSSSSSTLRYSRTTIDSQPSTSTAVKTTEQLEPLFTSRSSRSGSEIFSDTISQQTSASYATPRHHPGLTRDTHPSPTHTAEMMLAGGLPKNRRRPATSPESQHVTMRGTITRGNSVGQPVKIQLDLTETEFRRLTSQEPQTKEDFKCQCGHGQGPHIILWSLLCIPVAIVMSLSIAFYNGSMAWYNLIIYFSEEKTIFHKVVLCPLIILTFPVTVGISALLISLVAAAMQISWSWRRWLAEIHDGEKGFYDHLHCTQNNTISAPVSFYRSLKENLSTMHELRSTGEDPILSPIRIGNTFHM